MTTLPRAIVEIAGHQPPRLSIEGGDLARSEDLVVWVSGHLRNRGPEPRPVAARDLLARGWVSADDIDPSRFTGNALVLCLDLHRPRFLAYSTLFAMPQLYGGRRVSDSSPETFVLATDLRSLAQRLDRVEIDEEALPLHFLFRFVPGHRTYLRGVERVFPGERWRGGPGAVSDRRRLVDLAFPESGPETWTRLDDDTLSALDERSSAVVGAYINACRSAGRPAASLLSGGLDSSLLQSWMGDHDGGTSQRPSFGFAVPDAPSFGFETGYARDASRLLGTEHTFLSIRRDDYPDLLRRAVATIVQPALFNEGWACHVALAERLGPEHWTVFAGNGADAVHGILDLVEVERSRRLRRWPGLSALLTLAGPLLRRLPRLEPWIDAARCRDDLASLRSPTDRVSIAGELEHAVEAFGAGTVRRAFDQRRAIGDDFLSTADPYERLQVLDLATAGYDPTVAVTQIYAGFGVEVVQPFLDEELLRAAFRFAPSVRFFAGPRPNSRTLKPLQRRLLERRGLGAIVNRRKGGTTFYREVWAWMQAGILRPLVDAIERPAFLSPSQLDRLVRQPNDFAWNLLVYDLFRREVAALDSAARQNGVSSH